MSEYIPPGERPGVEWTYAAKVTLVLGMDDRMYGHVVLNHTFTNLNEDRLHAYLDVAHAHNELLVDEMDPEVILAFRGEQVDPEWLAVAARAGLTEAEIRAALTSGVPDRDTLETLAALRCQDGT